MLRFRHIKGIIYLVVSCWFIWHEHSGREIDTWGYEVTKWADAQGSEVSTIILLFLLVINISAFVYLLKGASFVFFMGGFNEEEYKKTGWSDASVDWKSFFSLQSWAEAKENVDINAQNANIEKMKIYRDSKFSNMGNETMASEYRDTAWLDSLGNNKAPNASKARGYIDSKLSIMDNESGYQWLKGEKK